MLQSNLQSHHHNVLWHCTLLLAIMQTAGILSILTHESVHLSTNVGLQDLVSVVSEAFICTEADDPQLLAQLAANARPTAAEQLDKLRHACLSLVCAALSWDEFRTTQSPTPADAPANAPRSRYRQVLWG